jgi:hypothetical protein
MESLNKAAGNMELIAFTPTFGMLLIRHFREEEQSILISGVMNDVLTSAMLRSLAQQDFFANCKEEMFTESKTKAVEAAMISYTANKPKFESQAPCTDEDAAQHHIDKLISKVISNFEDNVADSLVKLSYQGQDVSNNDKRALALEWCKPVCCEGSCLHRHHHSR